jgi:hypothetical protein
MVGGKFFFFFLCDFFALIKEYDNLQVEFFKKLMEVNLIIKSKPELMLLLKLNEDSYKLYEKK